MAPAGRQGVVVNIMACAYVLYSEIRKQFYTGCSYDDSPESRLILHNHGQTKSTRFGRPWRIIHYEYFKDFLSARHREVYLKSGIGREWIKEEWQSGRMRRS
jgi:putative endonuclease